MTDAVLLLLTCVGVRARLLVEGDTMAIHGWFCIT